MPIADVLQVTCYNLTKYGDPGHFVCKYSGWGHWGDSNCLSVAKKGLKIYSYSTILFESCMEQLYIEALLIHWHTGLKFSSVNRNPQIPEIGRKNRSIHPNAGKAVIRLLCLISKMVQIESIEKIKTKHNYLLHPEDRKLRR